MTKQMGSNRRTIEDGPLSGCGSPRAIQLHTGHFSA